MTALFVVVLCWAAIAVLLVAAWWVFTGGER